MHSSIERILIAAKKLPDDLQVIFEGYFMKGNSVESICSQHNITESEFKNRHERLMREMRAMH